MIVKCGPEGRPEQNEVFDVEAPIEVVQTVRQYFPTIIKLLIEQDAVKEGFTPKQSHNRQQWKGRDSKVANVPQVPPRGSYRPLRSCQTMP